MAIDSEDAIVTARSLARDRARGIGFSALDQARIATAVSELARNVIRYATESRGEMSLREITAESRIGIEIIVRDDGPGISSLERAMEPGFTSGQSGSIRPTLRCVRYERSMFLRFARSSRTECPFYVGRGWNHLSNT